MPYMTIDKNRVFYRLSKKPDEDKKTLIFIHGSGGEGSVWGYQLSGLAGSFKLVIPDLPSHGKSEGKCFDTIKEYAVWLNALAESLGLSSVYLAGHSLGGAVAQEFAIRYPEKTEGLILIGTGLGFDVSKDYLNLLQNDFEKTVKTSCDNAYAGSVPKEQYHKGFEMLLKNGKNTLYKDMLACKIFDGSAFAPAIKSPCLIICGQEDRITVPDLSRQLSEKIDNSKLCLIPDTGHMAMIEAHKTVNREIENFVIS